MSNRRALNPAHGFLLACFAVIGLVGIMSTYLAPLPLARAMRRDTTLDAVLVAAASATPAAALAALKPMLDDSAEAVLPNAAPIDPAAIAPRVAAERLAMRARFETEQAELSLRLRVMIGVVTLLGGGFGLAIARIGQSAERQSPERQSPEHQSSSPPRQP